MKVKDIRLKDYLKLKNTTQYDIWVEHIQPSPYLNGRKSKGMYEWTFDEVSFLRKEIQKFDLQSIKNVYSICFSNKKILKFVEIKPNILKMWTFEMLSWWKWVAEQLKTINDYESSLASDPDPIAMQAGIDRMKRFEYLNTKIPLAQAFSTNPKEVGKWLWLDVFIYSDYFKTKGEVDKRYAEIISKKRR